MGRQMPRQRHLHLGPDPARHAVLADQHHEGGATRQGLFQSPDPAVAGADRPVILEHTEARPLQFAPQGRASRLIIAAIAEKDVIRD